MSNRKILKSYRLNPEMVKGIHRVALEKGWTNTNVVIHALQEYFERHEKNESLIR